MGADVDLNNFDVVYQSGGLLYYLGLEKDDKKAVLKSKELLEHSLTLIDQPHAHNIGKTDIYDDLSGICFILDECEKQSSDTIIFNAKKTSEEIGAGRASVYRALSSLQDSGLIVFTNKQIQVINKNNLERI